MKACIVGTGSFGTSIAQLISRNLENVYLLSRNSEVIESINNFNINKYYYPSDKLSKNITCYDISNSEKFLDESDLIIFALPSGSTREVAAGLKIKNHGEKIILSTSKGIEFPSIKTMSQVIKQETGNNRIISFSGPTFADEMIYGDFTCGTFGIEEDNDHREVLLNVFKSDNFLFDTSPDVTGVELCGVLKNIYSIAVGIFDSNSNSNNEHYAFLNLCFKEMYKILNEFSEDKDLILKFCAFGDFNLTTNSDKSRNRTLGLMVGKGMLNLNEFNPSIIFEGLKSVKALEMKTRESGIKAPIVNFVHEMLSDVEGVRNKLNNLLKELQN